MADELRIRLATVVDEVARLAHLVRLRLLDSEPDERWNRPLRLAALATRVPIALISLVDADRQWFLARVGLDDVLETPRSQSFCAHAITGPTVQMVIPDASLDARFVANPLVTGPPHIRAYAGHVIEIDGHPLGTVCIIDTAPRQFDAQELRSLDDAARIVEREIVISRL